MTERANEKIKLVLERILEEHSLGAENSIQHLQGFEIAVEDLLKDTDIDSVRLRRIIEHLAENGIIADFKFWNGEDAKYPDYEPFYDLYYFRFPENFREIAKDYITQLSTFNELSKDYTNGTILYLDKDGNFWHGNKEQFCYPMKVTSNRFSILKYLIENDGYQSPKDMLPHINTKTTQTLRSEIGKIRKNITKFLGIDGDDLINSKEDSGYRINPKYKILMSKS